MPALHAQHNSSSNMPWDEVDQEDVQEEEEISVRWRLLGQARRRKLLDDDRRKGGTKFNLNTSCSIHRYFQVAHRVRLRRSSLCQAPFQNRIILIPFFSITGIGTVSQNVSGWS
jgi:hypothetical protein